MVGDTEIRLHLAVENVIAVPCYKLILDVAPKDCVIRSLCCINYLTKRFMTNDLTSEI